MPVWKILTPDMAGDTRLERSGVALSPYTLQTLANPERYRDAVDTQGRLIAPNTQLLALQLMREADETGFGRIFQVLKRRLVDYTDSAFSSDQRRFLMKQLQSLRPDDVEFPTLAAEQLAARYLESNPPRPTGLFSSA